MRLIRSFDMNKALPDRHDQMEHLLALLKPLKPLRYRLSSQIHTAHETAGGFFTKTGRTKDKVVSLGQNQGTNRKIASSQI